MCQIRLPPLIYHTSLSGNVASEESRRNKNSTKFPSRGVDCGAGRGGNTLALFH